ncbi:MULTISPECIES: VanZ family protein [unclassified Facklamia]|uniref:VanZ family protein n=1 Tax=Aerococcaceae TaxID=186827 RepID=UPI0013BC12F0|nr:MULTISPECIES: VanZ family protein [unclassified Facklamia]NEW63726.1 hypothetical protein [Facklamia sp. 252]NEW67197.1 hypothetical protein [Facklamia sp. 253]QQD66263.1 VanZ family protein [Aerococcaceae bacterium zg-252]
MKKWIAWSSLWLLTVMVIFIFSNQPGELSSQSSGWVMKQIVGILQFFFPTLEGSAQLESNIRVLAHASIYTVLGAISVMVVYSFCQWREKALSVMTLGSISWGMTLMISLADEYNQLSVAGRDGSWGDVIVDMLGTTLAVLVVCKIVIKRKTPY